MITAQELRQKYLDFFKEKGHAIIPSASLIPENDPTVLFTTAGMHPLVPYLTGEPHPAGKRLADVQKCIRTQDIDEVGDKTHDTFFEMLGNWSLGDYFKQDAIAWSWEFLTDPKWLGLDPKRLAISVFAGDNDAPRDDEAAHIWKSLGVPEERIAYLGKTDNWWGPAGQTGPCGPDTEMFYWIGEGEAPAKFDPSDSQKWIEIWNDVFMQYNKKADGTNEPLKQKNVDTGMGLERTLVALNGYEDIFQIDTLKPIIDKIEELSGKQYLADEGTTKSMRIVADHIRTATMIMADPAGIVPSNTEHGYIVRRLLRRAIRYAKQLGIESLVSLVEPVVQIFKDVYPEVETNKNFIVDQVNLEVKQFSKVLAKGLKEFEKVSNNLTDREISGVDAFNLFVTYGFPVEVTQELASDKGLIVNLAGFEKEFEKHQDISRSGAEQKFASGLADHSEKVIRYHTATHLLQASLRKVLGEHVEQKGSNITKDRLRFDFSHDKKMTPEELVQVESLVNEAIKKDYPVTWTEMTVAEAKDEGAIGLFEHKYGNRVKVYSIGNPTEPAVSKELCSGPHVEHTSEIGKFKIIKESASSAGVRRIKAVIESPDLHSQKLA